MDRHITIGSSLPAGTPGPTFTVSLSGPACGPADLSCQVPATTAQQVCVVVPRAAGTCHIEVNLAGGGRISKDIHVTDYTEPCCGGLYPDENSIDTLPATPDAGAG